MDTNLESNNRCEDSMEYSRDIYNSIELSEKQIETGQVKNAQKALKELIDKYEL